MAGVATMCFKFVQRAATAKGAEGGGRRWRINCLRLGVGSSQVNGVSGRVGMASGGGGRNQS